MRVTYNAKLTLPDGTPVTATIEIGPEVLAPIVQEVVAQALAQLKGLIDQEIRNSKLEKDSEPSNGMLELGTALTEAVAAIGSRITEPQVINITMPEQSPPVIHVNMPKAGTKTAKKDPGTGEWTI